MEHQIRDATALFRNEFGCWVLHRCDGADTRKEAKDREEAKKYARDLLKDRRCDAPRGEAVFPNTAAHASSEEDADFTKVNGGVLCPVREFLESVYSARLYTVEAAMRSSPNGVSSDAYQSTQDVSMFFGARFQENKLEKRRNLQLGSK